MTAHDGGAPPRHRTSNPSGDAVPDFAQKAQENAHHEDPATEQAWLGNEPDPFTCCALAVSASAKRLRRIERTSRRATTAFENGEFDAGIAHLENALRLALHERTLTTTEGSS